MEKMRNLVAIVILQLIITIAETKTDFTFGDMIAFERKCCQKTYNHYAIYVGDKDFGALRKPGENIFHVTGPVKAPLLVNCVFGKLKKTDTYKIFNYLDGHPNFTTGTETEIFNRIKEKHRHCKLYSPFSNNCEHLATYVRYGEKLSLQIGQDAAKHCKNNEEIMKKLGPIDDLGKTCEEMCAEHPSRASG